MIDLLLIGIIGKRKKWKTIQKLVSRNAIVTTALLLTVFAVAGTQLLSIFGTRSGISKSNAHSEFLYAYYKKTAKMLEKEGIDWSQSRIIFITPEFTKY